MRLSCLPVSFYGPILRGEMTVGDWARLARELDLDALDLSILFLESRSLPEVSAMGRQIEAEGMKVSVVTTYPDFTHPDPAERARQGEKLAADLDRCRLVGAEMVRVTAGQAHPGIGRAHGIDLAVEGLRRAAELAARAGVSIVFENHSKPGVWKYADFSHPSDIFLDIARAISGLPIGILFDTANPAAFGDDPCVLLREVVRRVACVHAADTGAHGALKPVQIGTGVVPFPAIFNLLKESGYDGMISIEEASNTGVQGLRSAVSFVRKTWGRGPGERAT